MKTVNCGQAGSSTLLRGPKQSIFLYKTVHKTATKVTFVIHESQKVAYNLFLIRRCFKVYSSLLKSVSYSFSISDVDKLFVCEGH